jgi:hypothetical protein
LKKSVKRRKVSRGAVIARRADMRKSSIVAVSLLCLTWLPSNAAGALITEFVTPFTGGISCCPIGQEVVTPSGDPWTDITFNFFALDENHDTPTASGSLFVLDQEFLGDPATLGAAIPGFLAQSTAVVSGVWQFSNALVLLPETHYFFYTNAPLTIRGHGGDGTLSPGTSYVATPLFSNNSLADLNFRLSGTATPVPEPASLLLIAAGLAGSLAAQRRKQRHK